MSWCQDWRPGVLGVKVALTAFTDAEGDTVAPRKERETTEYAAMLGRMVKAYGRRVGQADPEDLATMLELHAQFGAAIQDAVSAQRADHGRSWADIARGAGTTRQAAQARWGR